MSVENLAPHVIKRIAKEMADLVCKPPEGIQIIPNSDISDIQAIVEGPAGTPYQKGHFKVKLVLGKTFPANPPTAFIMTKVFHPNVSAKTGEVCVNTLKKDWCQEYGIKHILLVIKCLLIVPNAESALNEDAAKLLLEDYEEYCKRAKMITEIHAKPSSEKEKLEGQNLNVNDTYSATNSQPFTRKQPDTESTGPVQKKQASNTNNILRSTLGLAKQTNNKENKKRNLKRL